MCAYVCMCPYLKTSGSGPIKSWEMVKKKKNKRLKLRSKMEVAQWRDRGEDGEERVGTD